MSCAWKLDSKEYDWVGSETQQRPQTGDQHLSTLYQFYVLSIYPNKL